MRRLTAAFLLLLVCAVTAVPAALAAAAPAPRACCLRHEHRCHDSAAASSGIPSSVPGSIPSVQGTSCCNHDCCRAAATSQKAQPQLLRTVAAARQIDVLFTELARAVPAQQVPTFQSPRAPPAVPVA